MNNFTPCTEESLAPFVDGDGRVTDFDLRLYSSANAVTDDRLELIPLMVRDNVVITEKCPITIDSLYHKTEPDYAQLILDAVPECVPTKSYVYRFSRNGLFYWSIKSPHFENDIWQHQGDSFNIPKWLAPNLYALEISIQHCCVQVVREPDDEKALAELDAMDSDSTQSIEPVFVPNNGEPEIGRNEQIEAKCKSGRKYSTLNVGDCFWEKHDDFGCFDIITEWRPIGDDWVQHDGNESPLKEKFADAIDIKGRVHSRMHCDNLVWSKVAYYRIVKPEPEDDDDTTLHSDATIAEPDEFDVIKEEDLTPKVEPEFDVEISDEGLPVPSQPLDFSEENEKAPKVDIGSNVASHIFEVLGTQERKVFRIAGIDEQGREISGLCFESLVAQINQLTNPHGDQ